MGDRCWVRVKIGGKMTLAVWQELLIRVLDEAPDEIEDYSPLRPPIGGHLEAYFAEVNYGGLPLIEVCVAAHRLEMLKHDGPGDGYSEMTYLHRNGDVTVYDSRDGVLVMTIADVLKLWRDEPAFERLEADNGWQPAGIEIVPETASPCQPGASPPE